MTNIIVAFSKTEDAKSIKNILNRSGFQVIAVCTSGAQALNYADSLSSGIMICGYRFEDMLYQGIHDDLPNNFEMLLIASPSRCSGNLPPNLVFLPMPLRVHDLIDTLEMMIETQSNRKKRQKILKKERNCQEKHVINQAKKLLMERNSMSESEAYRYIQKCSMDNSTNMVETAQMVLSLINK